MGLPLSPLIADGGALAASRTPMKDSVFRTTAEEKDSTESDTERANDSIPAVNGSKAGVLLMADDRELVMRGA